jgi:hypothetical protein
MWSTKEIWEAGRAALAAKEAPTPAPAYFAAPAPAPAPVAQTEAVFDAPAFGFEARTYRITFKNGNSGEYDGAVLAGYFPFDPREVARVEPVEEVGQGR